MAANSRGWTYIIGGCVFTCLAALFVVLRFLARWKTGVSFRIDDYLLCVAMVFAFSMLGENVLWARDGGLGKPFASLTLNERTIFFKCFLANQFSYTFFVPCVKISILLFYRQIFAVRTFSIITFIVGGIVTAWTIAVFFTALFQCQPVAFYWDKSLSGTCINSQTFFWGNSISNLLTDVIILVLPLPMIWRLQISARKKIAVSGLFLLGSFVCVASIMRIAPLGLIADIDISYSLVDAALWIEIEPCVGVVCACLPTIRPLFTGIFPSLLTTRSRRTGGRSDTGYPTSTAGRARSITVTRPYGVLNEDPPERKGRSTTLSRSERDGSYGSHEEPTSNNSEYPLNDMVATETGPKFW